MDGKHPILTSPWSDRTGLDFSDRRLQLIEHRDAAFDQRIPVERRPDPAGCFTHDRAAALAMLPDCHARGRAFKWRT
jgi:hypothetical protein